VLQIRSILAPTDFSPHADTAVRYACQLAEVFKAKLYLLHVLAEVIPVGPDPMLSPVLSPEYYRETEEAASQTLGSLIKADWAKPTALETSVQWGVPVDTVVDFAQTHSIDLIVIATHGRTGLSHVLLGSVAERIVREAPCPVLTIRDRTPS
jgi:nucleotide-binding universal stress UspA family protein